VLQSRELCYREFQSVIIRLQTYELIIVDDCSTDNSKSVIEKWLLDYPEIQFIANETNLGSTKSFNKALKIAKEHISLT
jgi:glycosyltransferase involved in cell wall biosynthesis